MSALDAYRRHFGAPDGYLDFARYGPPSHDVVEAVSATTRALSTGELAVDTLQAVEDSARRKVADLTGRDGTDAVALSPNTSAGLLHLAFAVPAGPVLVSAREFPANVYPWQRAAELRGGAVQWLDTGDDGRVTADRVAAALTPDTVALAVSGVDFRTGYRADLAALRDAIGDRLLIVDGIQAFGVADLDWSVADAVAVGGQKWLRAGWGTGFISLSQKGLEVLGGGLTGWTGVRDAGLFDGRIHDRADSAIRLTTTNPDLVAMSALDAALDVLQVAGPAAVDARVASVVEALSATVTGRGGDLLSPAAGTERAGIVSFTLPGVAEGTVKQALAEAGVTVTARPGSVRMSPHATTPDGVVDTVDGVLAELAEGRA